MLTKAFCETSSLAMGQIPRYIERVSSCCFVCCHGDQVKGDINRWEAGDEFRCSTPADWWSDFSGNFATRYSATLHVVASSWRTWAVSTFITG